MAGTVCSKSKEAKTFPDTLAAFGYQFDKDGKLKNIETGEEFEFVVREGDQNYNQKHYEALGEVLTEEVYKLLETDCKLKRCPVPHDAKDGEPNTFIFMSEDAMTNPDKILVLIHGSGVVRAGQWARRLVINDSLDSGTQIPFIKKAQEEGYGVVVMNTNDNYRVNTKKKRDRIRGSENPENHALYVWDNYIKKCKSKHIALVVHSYGGCVTTALFMRRKEEFIKRVFAVAMTDSVHFISSPATFKELVRVSCNWVCSQRPLDTPVSTQPGDIKRVSSGVTVHEMTSWASIHSIFKFLKQRLDAVLRPEVEVIDSDASVENEVLIDADAGGVTGKDDADGANGKDGDTDGANRKDGDADGANRKDDDTDGASKKVGDAGDANRKTADDSEGQENTVSPASKRHGTKSDHEDPHGEGKSNRPVGGHDISDDEEQSVENKKAKINT